MAESLLRATPLPPTPGAVRKLKISVPLAPERGREVRSEGAVHALSIPEERPKKLARCGKKGVSCNSTAIPRTPSPSPALGRGEPIVFLNFNFFTAPLPPLTRGHGRRGEPNCQFFTASRLSTVFSSVVATRQQHEQLHENKLQTEGLGVLTTQLLWCPRPQQEAEDSPVLPQSLAGTVGLTSPLRASL